MFEGFNHPDFTTSKNYESYEDSDHQQRRRKSFLNKFKKMKSVNLQHYLAQNPSSSFTKFTREKYKLLVHAKMECSLFGNLSRRKSVTGGAFPDTEFFSAFAEMARHVWGLMSHRSPEATPLRILNLCGQFNVVVTGSKRAAESIESELIEWRLAIGEERCGEMEEKCKE
ncbi:Protein GRAVITROPIC IN THE LIGHT 1 [Linum perenne]